MAKRTRNSNAQCARTTLPPGPTNGPNHHHRHHHHRSPPSPPAREPHFDSSRHPSPPLAFLRASFFLSFLPSVIIVVVAVLARPRVYADPFKLQILHDQSFTFPFTFPYDGFHERGRGDKAIARRRDNLGVNDREEEVTLSCEGKGKGFFRAFVVNDYGDDISYRIRYFLLVPYHARRISRV